MIKVDTPGVMLYSSLMRSIVFTNSLSIQTLVMKENTNTGRDFVNTQCGDVAVTL